jgi:hypothetical protein
MDLVLAAHVDEVLDAALVGGSRRSDGVRGERSAAAA